METLALLAIGYGVIGMIVFVLYGLVLATKDKNPVTALIVGSLWPLALTLLVLIQFEDN